MTESQKEKWGPCLVLDLMSSEESGDEDGEDEDSEGGHAFRVRPLPWRSEKVTSFYIQLDKKFSKKQSRRSSIMTLKRHIGLVSDRPQPYDLPNWMVKSDV